MIQLRLVRILAGSFEFPETVLQWAGRASCGPRANAKPADAILGPAGG